MPKSLTLSSKNDIVVDSNVRVESTVGPANVTFTSDSDGSGSGRISMSGGSTILTNGGNIVFQGGGADVLAVGRSGDAGIALSGATLDATLGNESLGGTIQLKGSSSSTGGSGVLIEGSTIRSAGGSVSIRGNATSVANEELIPHGIDIAGTTISGGAGVDIRGDSNLDDGVRLSLTTIESVGGSVKIVGTSSTSYGVLVFDTTTISATKSINLTGDTAATSQAGLVLERERWEVRHSVATSSCAQETAAMRIASGSVAPPSRPPRPSKPPARWYSCPGRLTGEGIVNPTPSRSVSVRAPAPASNSTLSIFPPSTPQPGG